MIVEAFGRTLWRPRYFGIGALPISGPRGFSLRGFFVAAKISFGERAPVGPAPLSTQLPTISPPKNDRHGKLRTRLRPGMRPQRGRGSELRQRTMEPRKLRFPGLSRFRRSAVETNTNLSAKNFRTGRNHLVGLTLLWRGSILRRRTMEPRILRYPGLILCQQ